jgi:hypothetical protein
VALIDKRGRIAGRVNLIDAIIVSAVIGLGLTAYGGYRLFRTTRPKLFTISPTVIAQGENVHLIITGENLRPNMRITFNNAEAESGAVLWDPRQLVTARSYVRGSSNFATFELPELRGGTYDVVLWNAGREVARLSRVLRVLPLAPPLIIEMEVTGVFPRLPHGETSQLKAGAQFSASGSPTVTVLNAGVPTTSTMQIRAGSMTATVPIQGHVDLPASLRLTCFTVSNPDGSVRCAVPGPVQQADVVPGSSFLLKSSDAWIAFYIAEVGSPRRSRLVRREDTRRTE